VKRGVFELAGFAVGGIAAGAAYEWWRSKRGEDLLDVYFDDGSFVTYVDGSSEAERLLPLARAVLEAVHA
jgi:hypothetical protein